jgi:hypothetical protein
MPAINTSSPTAEINGRTLDITSLPEASIAALISRGLSHFFGNEQASRVSAAKDAFKKEHGVDMADDEVNVVKAERFETAWKALADGTIGQRAVGITIDPVEKVVDRLVRESVIATLKAAGIKVPTKKDQTVKFGNGVEKTMAQMCETRKGLGKDPVSGTVFADAAAKIVKDQQKAKAKAESTVAEMAKDAESLGL